MTSPDRRALARDLALPIPLPAGWYDDPDYVLSPYAIAGADGAAPPQYAAFGTCTRGDEQIALNYDDCFAHAYFGAPGSGKSYTEGVLIESALIQNRYQTRLPRPLCAVVLSYGTSGGGRPAAEQFAARLPNQDPAEVRALITGHGTLPQGIDDVIGLTLARSLPALQGAVPGCPAHALSFSSAELGLPNLRRLMLLPEDRDSLLGEEIGELLAALPPGFGRGELLAAVEAYPFRGAHLRGLARRRIRLAGQLLRDSGRLRDLIQPGRLIIVDLREAWLAPRGAMRLFQVLLDVLLHGPGALPCNLLLCLDEAHKLLKNAELRLQVEHAIRERRHLRLSLVLSSQDPLSMPHSTLAELDGVGLFQTASARSIAHLARDVAPFSDLLPEDSARLRPGQMYFWSRSWHEPFRPGELFGRLVRIKVRPRMSHHGGATRRATG